MLVCVATLWAFFFGLNWLSGYDEDDISARTADGSESGWVQIADENNYGVNFMCGDKQRSALFSQPSMGEAYALTFDRTRPDSATSLFYSFRRN